MDAFWEAILENKQLAKRDARTPWKTFYEAPRASGKVLSTPCTLASKGAADNRCRAFRQAGAGNCSPKKS